MHNQAVIEISMDSRRRRIRSRLMRVLVPVGSVIIMLAAILSITMFSYHNNRQEALALSEKLLEALDQRIATEVSTYLSPATDMVKLGADIIKHQNFNRHSYAIEEQLAIDVLKNYPQLAVFSFGDTKGNFFMHKKMSDGSIHTKVIERKAEATLVTWLRRNSNGNVVKKETFNDDSYDPRIRPWYQGAVKTRQLFWTDVYSFTDQKPGITASMQVIGLDGKIIGVVGLDIELEQLSTFLKNLKIGKKGRALLIDEQGRLIAYPEIAHKLKRVDKKFQQVRLDKLGDPVLTRAFNRFRIEGHGSRDLIVDDRRYLNTVSSLKAAVGRDWSVIILVPEEDFVGFVTKNILMTIGILSIASILAGLLILQSLRADYNALLVLERQHELEAQSRAFSELASKAALFDPANNKSLSELTRIVSETVRIRRTSVWHLEGQQLICSDSYDCESNGHTQGTVLAQDDFPLLFEVLLKGELIIVVDASHEPCTSELYRVYLHPLGCESLLAAPIVYKGQTAGAVWFERESKSHEWASEYISFAQAIANMLALRMSTNARHPQKESVASSDIPIELKTVDEVPSSPAKHRIVPRQEMRTTSIGGNVPFEKRLSALGNIGADIFTDATILVLRFTDPISLAMSLGESETTTAIDLMVCHLEDLATSYGIEYLKIMSDQIMCATGLDGDSDEHTHLIAELALAIQDQCNHLFANLDARMDFRIGIDKGAVIGSQVGHIHKSYNLWGETVQTAFMMADAGVPGSIQVTESTYQCLKKIYLFKVRGTYYLQDVGEFSTYLLTRRI